MQIDEKSSDPEIARQVSSKGRCIASSEVVSEFYTNEVSTDRRGGRILIYREQWRPVPAGPVHTTLALCAYVVAN